MAEWLNIWNQKANTENYFTQTGRGNSFTMFEFLLYIQDVQNALKLSKDDHLLDIGGGPGWVAMHLSPWVSSIVMTDFSAEMVEQAKKQVKAFGNINAFQENILNTHSWDLRFCMKFNKVLVGSVLQYLNSMNEVKQALQNIYNVMTSGGIALFTHNPDLRKKESHIAAMPQTEESLKMEQERLWIDSDEVCIMAEKIGFKSYCKVPINPLIWQSTHMLDFAVTR